MTQLSLNILYYFEDLESIWKQAKTVARVVWSPRASTMFISCKESTRIVSFDHGDEEAETAGRRREWLDATVSVAFSLYLSRRLTGSKQFSED